MGRTKAETITKKHENSAKIYAEQLGKKYAAAIIKFSGERTWICDNNRRNLERFINQNLKEMIYLKAKIMKAK